MDIKRAKAISPANRATRLQTRILPDAKMRFLSPQNLRQKPQEPKFNRRKFRLMGAKLKPEMLISKYQAH